VRIVVAHSQINALGGGERVALELLRRLGRRHEIALWAGNYRPSDTYAGLADFPRRDLAPWEWLACVPHADAVVTHTFGAHLLALRHPCTLCYVHTLRSIYLQRADRPDLLARRLLDRAALRRAGAVATNSTYTASRIVATYGRRAEVIPCGVDEALFDVSEALGAYALYVGRLAPEKGLERLLAWSADLPIDLALVGAGPADYVAHLKARAGPRVRWLGALQGEELRRAYAGCRLLAFLPHEEEFGLAALEAMAAARPVVAAPEGGLPALVRDGASGYLVRDVSEFAAAVERLLADEALCARLGRVGRALARGYTWDAMAERIEARCLELAARRPSSQPPVRPTLLA
jgi:glycosyltransferase involved in cell wall biosynthesis